MLAAIVSQEREGAGGARTVADGCVNVPAMLYGICAMSLVAHSRCWCRSKITEPAGGAKRGKTNATSGCVYISGSMQAIG